MSERFDSQSPAIATRLREARRATGYTQQQVADAAGLARTTVVAIEKGERDPRPDELVRIAEFLGRSVNEILRPTPPPPDLAASFRLGGTRTSEQEALQSSVLSLSQLLDDYVELERLANAPLPQRYPPESDVAGLPPGDAGESLAGQERNRLGLGDGPVLQLRQLLEVDVGLRVFSLPLPSHVAGLFAFHPSFGGAIGFSSAHPYERQRWTLAHEYGHFLAQRAHSEATVMTHQRLSASERFAESFAENFLMPADGLKRRFNEIRMARSDGVTPADLVMLADRYKVSLQALVLRLENLGLVRSHTYDRLTNSGFKVEEAKKLLELSSAPPDNQMLPIRFKYLVVEAVTSGRISEGQASTFLRADRVDVRELVQALAGGSAAQVGEPLASLWTDDSSE
jgi:Zn-dependent peptidase ImmA (M78 family)/transcriptional regulator with XRE-family HTH domain